MKKDYQTKTEYSSIKDLVEVENPVIILGFQTSDSYCQVLSYSIIMGP